MKKSVLILSEIHLLPVNLAKQTVEQTIRIWLAKQLRR